MAEYQRPQNEQDFAQNFAPLHPLMNATEAYYESSRCLFCYDAPCIKACPTSIDIPLFIRQIQSNNLRGAALTIYESNYLGNACGKVCPTEVLCEGACVYNEQGVKPIEIGRLQHHATAWAIDHHTELWHTPPNNGYRVAIIGAGPAGIACACELRRQGVQVSIYEAKPQASGLTVHGVAPYKITNTEVLDEVAYLQQQLGFVVHYSHPIHTAEQLQHLATQYHAVFLGIGLGETATLGIEGEHLEGCIGAVEWIEQLRHLQHQLSVPQAAVVLGGGNTAMDAASECARMGVETVTLAYRRSKADMGAYAFEYELAKTTGIRSLFGVQPTRIIGDANGKVQAVELVRTHTTPDGKLHYLPNTEHTIACQLLIKATGQAKQTALLRLIEGLQLDQNNRIVTDPHTGQTTNPQYFAGGDAVNGGKEVVNAAAEGKQAARHIWAYVQQLERT